MSPQTIPDPHLTQVLSAWIRKSSLPFLVPILCNLFTSWLLALVTTPFSEKLSWFCQLDSPLIHIYISCIFSKFLALFPSYLLNIPVTSPTFLYQAMATDFVNINDFRSTKFSEHFSCLILPDPYDLFVIGWFLYHLS